MKLFWGMQSRYPLPLLLDSLDASEQETPPIEDHLEDRERCFAEMTAATVCDLGLLLRPVGRWGNFPRIEGITSPAADVFGLRASPAEEQLT
ncbi:hypothetical protein [Novipirellula aureliae]|nr:hypothetical protein [Novipirellula aureliae]